MKLASASQDIGLNEPPSNARAPRKEVTTAATEKKETGAAMDTVNLEPLIGKRADRLVVRDLVKGVLAGIAFGRGLIHPPSLGSLDLRVVR